MSDNFEEMTAAAEAVGRNYLIVKIAHERVLSRGRNTANQQETKTALKQVERALSDVN